MGSAIAMEEGPAREALAEQLFRFWDSRFVDAGSNDSECLGLLAELAAMEGDTEHAKEWLGNSNMVRRPKTYAIALRYGMDQFVTDSLPDYLREIYQSYNESSCWVLPETTERYATIADGFDDPQFRLVVTLFLARLPIRNDNGNEPDPELLDAALCAVGEQLTEATLVQWAAEHFRSVDREERLKLLRARRIADADVLDLLRRNNSAELNGFVEDLNTCIEAGKTELLPPFLKTVEQEFSEALFGSTAQRNVSTLLFARGLEADDPEVCGIAMSLFRKMEQCASANTRPLEFQQPMLRLGHMLFAVPAPNWNEVAVSKRLEIFRAFDAEAEVKIGEKLESRWKELEAEGLGPAPARLQARKELVESWRTAADENGFLPLSRSLYHWFNTDCFTCAEKEQYLDYLRGLESGSLLLDQLKAAVSLSLSDRYPVDLYDDRAKDISRLLNRPDFDDAEKIRFVELAVEEGYAQLLSKVDARLPLLKALCSDPKMISEYGAALLRVYPQPADAAERPFYNQIADELLKCDIAGTEESARLIRLLSELERRDEAVTLVNQDIKDGLSVKQRLEAYQRLDAVFSRQGFGLQEYAPQDDFSLIYFALRNGDASARQEIIWALKENPDMEKVFGPEVLAKYPLPQENETVLYQRIATRMMNDYDRNLIHESIAPEHIRALFALGRNPAAMRLLDDESLYFGHSCESFAAALEGGAQGWCLSNLEALLSNNLFPGDTAWPKESLAGLIGSIEDPDLKLAAEIFFAGAPDRKQVARFKEHAFQRPLLAVHARARLERDGLLDPVNPDPAALEWFESIGQEQLRENAADMTELERLAVERYVNGMLDAGKASAVTAFYRQMDSVELSAENARWLSEIPLQREIALCEELLTGRSVSAPDRFVLISPTDRYQLQRAMDYLNRKSAGLSADMAGMNVAACYLGGRKEQLQDLKNVDGCSHERIFTGFTLLKGVQSGKPDEKKMKECIADFGAAMEYYKKQVSCGVIRHFNWYDVAAGILETYPYSLEPERWAAQLPELLPVALDPQRLEGFRMRRAQDKK